MKKIREFSLNKDMLKKYLIGKNYGPTISNTDIDKFQNELNHVLNNHHDIPMCDLQVYIKEIIEAITYNADDSLGIKIKYLD